MSTDKKDVKQVTVRLPPEEYGEIASLAREGIRSMPQQLHFMVSTWLPMALKLCELYGCGTPDRWAVNLRQEYREKKALSETLRIITDHESSLARPGGGGRIVINLPIANKTYERLRDLTIRMYNHGGSLERKVGGFLLELTEAAENMSPEELHMIRFRHLASTSQWHIDRTRKLRTQLRVIRGGLCGGPKRTPRVDQPQREGSA